MTRLHALAHDPSTDSPFMTASQPTRVIEVGEVTAGIAVPEHGGVRFFSSERAFDALDGALFGSVEQATRAARDHTKRPARGSKPKLSLV